MTAVGIEIDNVSRRFQLGSEEVWALRDVSIAIAPQEFLALIGRSGSGKTTLLNLLAGLDRPSSGTIRVDGKDLGAYSDRQLTELRRRQIGFIFQSFGLLPLLSALENVELALRIAGAARRDRGSRAREVLEMMGLGRRMNHRPYELSGGEQQRVAIARAIANRPALILADEPTGELDSATAISIFKLMRDVARSEGITIVTSTHDRTVMEMASRVEELADGRLQTGSHRDLLSYVEERSGRRSVDATGEPARTTVAAAVLANREAVRVDETGEAGVAATPVPAIHEAQSASVDSSIAWAAPGHQTLSPSSQSRAESAVHYPEADAPLEDLSRWAPPDRRS